MFIGGAVVVLPTKETPWGLNNLVANTTLQLNLCLLGISGWLAAWGCFWEGGLSSRDLQSWGSGQSGG